MDRLVACVCFLAALIFSVSCTSRGNVPTCEQIYQHTLPLYTEDAQESLRRLKDQAIKSCKEKYNTKHRKCLMAARNLDELRSCSN